MPSREGLVLTEEERKIISVRTKEGMRKWKERNAVKE